MRNMTAPASKSWSSDGPPPSSGSNAHASPRPVSTQMKPVPPRAHLAADEPGMHNKQPARLDARLTGMADEADQVRDELGERVSEALRAFALLRVPSTASCAAKPPWQQGNNDVDTHPLCAQSAECPDGISGWIALRSDRGAT